VTALNWSRNGVGGHFAFTDDGNHEFLLVREDLGRSEGGFWWNAYRSQPGEGNVLVRFKATKTLKAAKAAVQEWAEERGLA
jgi:hypothetical protein